MLAIITLGEGVIGTVASLSAVMETQQWSRDTILVAVAAHRERAFPWGYGHILIFGSIAATGAGLHVAASYIGHEAHIGATATVLTVAVPVAVFALALFGLYTHLVQAVDPFHFALLLGVGLVLALAVLLATTGVPMAVCLAVVMLAPLVVVIGYETVGHRHMIAALDRVLADREPS